jgi:hypothetical protein
MRPLTPLPRMPPADPERGGGGAVGRWSAILVVALIATALTAIKRLRLAIGEFERIGRDGTGVAHACKFEVLVVAYIARFQRKLRLT